MAAQLSKLNLKDRLTVFYVGSVVEWLNAPDADPSFKDIDLRLEVTERDNVEEEDGNVITYWRGPQNRAGYNLVRIADERIYAIASPKFLAENPEILNIDDLSNTTLLHLDEPYRLRPTWRDWFAHQNIEFEDDGGGLRFNDYALVLQACIAGEGIAMGWNHVTSNLIEKGLLKRINAEYYDIGYGFFACWSSAVKLTDDAATVLEWLGQQGSSI